MLRDPPRGNATLTQEEIASRVAELGAVQPWNHNFDLGGGVETRPGLQRSQGKNLVKFERLRQLLEALDLRGKLVIDIGCNEGFFALQIAQQGARVIGVDVDEHRIAKARFVQSVLGAPDVDFRAIAIPSEAFDALPRADLCLVLGVLHRVPDPYALLDAVGQHANMLLLEWKALKFGPHDEAFAYFSPKPIEREDIYGTEYWLLSFEATERILRRLGFTYFHRIDDSRQRRAIFVAGRVDHPVFRRADVSISRGRARSILSHTKRYLRTVTGVLTGRVNA